MAGGAELEEALAAFYWGTILPSVVEKTMAANFPYHSGYVLSTLNVNSYAGSYPAVDHEFQIKGRLAMGSEVDLDVVRRMIELQFKLMNDDPERSLSHAHFGAAGWKTRVPRAQKQPGQPAECGHVSTDREH